MSQSIVFFLAGVAASAGVNLLIDTAIGGLGTRLSSQSATSSGFMWLIASLLLTLAGSSLENARRRADRLSTPDLKPEVRRQLEDYELRSVRPRLLILLVAAGAVGAFGVVELYLHR